MDVVLALVSRLSSAPRVDGATTPPAIVTTVAIDAGLGEAADTRDEEEAGVRPHAARPIRVTPTETPGITTAFLSVDAVHGDTVRPWPEGEARVVERSHVPRVG